jgi:hypothetical protein
MFPIERRNQGSRASHGDRFRITHCLDRHIAGIIRVLLVTFLRIRVHTRLLRSIPPPHQSTYTRADTRIMCVLTPCNIPPHQSPQAPLQLSNSSRLLGSITVKQYHRTAGSPVFPFPGLLGLFSSLLSTCSAEAVASILSLERLSVV